MRAKYVAKIRIESMYSENNLARALENRLSWIVILLAWEDKGSNSKSKPRIS